MKATKLNAETAYDYDSCQAMQIRKTMVYLDTIVRVLFFPLEASLQFAKVAILY